MSSTLLAPLLALAVLLLAAAALRWQRASQRRLVGAILEAPVTGPSVLFFTGESCTVCHTAQRPALERMAPLLRQARVAVREVDVAEDRRLARRFRVMSLPTTVLLDGASRAVAVNVGYASDTELTRQLRDAGLLAPQAIA